MFNALKAFGHLDQFPKECWDKILEIATNGGLTNVKANLFEFLSCLFAILAWFLTKAKKPDAPIIGATGPGSSIIPLEVTTQCVDCEEQIRNAEGLPQPAAQGFIRDFAFKQVLSMMVAYALNALSDGDKMQEHMEQFAKWLREYLDGDEA